MGWCTAWERKSMLGAYWRPLAVWVCGEQVRPCGLPFSCRLMPVSGVWWLFGRAEGPSRNHEDFGVAAAMSLTRSAPAR